MRLWEKDQSTGAWTAVECTGAVPSFAVAKAWLKQVLRLDLGESPAWTDWGVPYAPTLAYRIYPDFYLRLLSSRMGGFFGSLNIVRLSGDGKTAEYDVQVSPKSN